MQVFPRWVPRNEIILANSPRYTTQKFEQFVCGKCITFVTIEIPYELTKLFCEHAERENYGIYFFKISALHIYITLQALCTCM